MDNKYNELVDKSNIYKKEVEEKLKDHHKLYNDYTTLEFNFKELQTKLLIMETTNNNYKQFYNIHSQTSTKPVQTNNNITIDKRSMTSNIQSDIVNICKTFEPLTSNFVYEQMKNISYVNLANYGVEYIATHALNSKLGINLIITDVSRRVCVYINKNNELIKDPVCSELVKLIIHETSKSENVKKALELANSLLDNITNIKEYNKIYKHIQDITTLSKNDPELLIYDIISVKLTKHGPTKKTINEKQKNFIINQINSTS